MKNETKRMAAWVFVQILFVVSLLLFVGGCSKLEPSWKMASRGADAIFMDLHVSDKEIGRLIHAIREKPGAFEIEGEAMGALVRVREAKWILRDVRDRMHDLHKEQKEGEERRKVLDKTE